MYQQPMNEHSTWVEDLDGYMTQPFSPTLSNDPFCRSPDPTHPDMSGRSDFTGYSNGFTGYEPATWTPQSMFSTMPIPPPNLSMPYFPMRLNSEPTPLPFSIEEEDESQLDSESHSMMLSRPSRGLSGIQSRLSSPLRRSLSSLSSIYGRHIHRGDNVIDRKKRLKRVLSLRYISEKVKAQF